MTAENRFSADQLAAFTPGDTVVIETPGDSRRPRHATGTVVRIEAPTPTSPAAAPAVLRTCIALAAATASASPIGGSAEVSERSE